ncbi:cobyric acid synthase [Desulfovibrio mangrovi]|uniref:cobyric acid synthase n=1 Tax=Desulfovibrio mangrovi TaxID=2976983 RepID=UPI002247F137|nr:cobyric acid synthase [Desulfovibrio mangrovi]UZP65864.1 cobyric acid synthase [Desulfovibrio mangrovi]
MPNHSLNRKIPALMLQGTSSNAGKSVLTAALCRILLQDGYSVAPFKAQNMALNSFVTPDGREIGRAQAVQAAACRLEPDARMNPVLLKPSSDTGSQVIVMGRVVGNMRVKEYVSFKPEAFRTVQMAYDSLAAEHDVMVLEGAGSPAEINLKAHDIVNMQMARYADARVLLVGDIDRGGVFASLVGTMELLDPWERELVVGFVLNRFRGDASLLDPALIYTTQKTGKPFFGVVPHVPELGLPEEDSVSFKEAMGRTVVKQGACVDVALIDLPHIANFTDMDALSCEPDVQIRGVRSPESLGHPDCIILPGSKNTLGDLAWLRSTGLAEAVTALAAGDAAPEIVGICGGLQMLGRSVEDPLQVESADRATDCDGLGLLNVHTVMGQDKVLTRVSGTHTGFDLPVNGYEIHHGRTLMGEGAGVAPCVVLQDGMAIGYSSSDGMVWGTYLHGLFDSDEFRRAFVDRLRFRKGESPLGRVVAPYSLDPALDRLAAVVREALDMQAVYRVLGLR